MTSRRPPDAVDASQPDATAAASAAAKTPSDGVLKPSSVPTTALPGPRAAGQEPQRTPQRKPQRKPRRAAQGALFLETNEDPAVLWAQDLQGPVAGLDEAGRGPLAGPVVAAAVVLPAPLPAVLAPLNDSKALDEAAREALFPLIQEHALGWGIAVAEAADIDASNILRASLQAMADALAHCEARLGTPVLGALLDGNQKAPIPPRVQQRTLVKGDSKSRPIMAASILAKVTRDRRMIAEDRIWPGYGFAKHKGYPTPTHLEALKALGPCPLHRRSFRPVQDVIDAADVGQT